MPLGIGLVPGVCTGALGDCSPGMDSSCGSWMGLRQVGPWGCSAEWEACPESMSTLHGRPARPLLPDFTSAAEEAADAQGCLLPRAERCAWWV